MLSPISESLVWFWIHSAAPGCSLPGWEGDAEMKEGMTERERNIGRIGYCSHSSVGKEKKSISWQLRSDFRGCGEEKQQDNSYYDSTKTVDGNKQGQQKTGKEDGWLLILCFL